MLGDSLSAGYGLPPGEAFPDVLQSILREKGYDVDVQNAGVSGDTAADGLARLDWSVGPDAQAVILELGANDMLRGLDPRQMKQSLSNMLARLRSRNVPVLLAGMYASPSLGADYDVRFRAVYPALAGQFQIPLYPFFLEGVAGHPDLQLKDGMHPNAEGVKRMVDGILPAVERFLDRITARAR